MKLHEVSAEDLRMMEEAVFGKTPVVTARFYDKQALDVSASRAQGQRVMMTKTYLHHECKKENASINRPMQEEDKHRYPEAWADYQRSKEHERSGQVQNLRTEDECAFIKAESG